MDFKHKRFQNSKKQGKIGPYRFWNVTKILFLPISSDQLQLAQVVNENVLERKSNMFFLLIWVQGR